jgi:SAM-dependent methyltransferase
MNEISGFTAHNIRLDDGTLTFPSAERTMDQHPVLRSVLRLLRVLFPAGLEGKTVMDVGCLEGGYVTEFARNGMMATGLEVRPSNYERCRLVQERVKLPNLRFVLDDAMNIGQHGRFDVFFICGLLYHLDQPRKFLEEVARNCGKALILHTHVAHADPSEGARHWRLSELCENEGLRGRWFPEHGDISKEELDQLAWASWENNRSFWIQKEYLLQLLKELGFGLVYEQFDHLDNITHEMTDGWHAKMDRVMLVGIKSDAGEPQGTGTLRDEVTALRNSTSWRITAPLRTLGRALGR